MIAQPKTSDFEAYWLVSVLAKLTLLRREYRTDPRGIAALSWATVKFHWDERSNRYHGIMVDSRIAVGNVAGAVIPNVNPHEQSVDSAAAAIDREIMRFLGYRV
jgi:hypothetical protein